MQPIAWAVIGASGVASGTGISYQNGTSTTGSADITLNNTGGGVAHTIMPPAMVLPFILRVI